MAEEEEDVHATIMCILKEWDPEGVTIVKGATVDLCGVCDREIWVAPSSYSCQREYQDKGGDAQFICLDCASALTPDDADIRSVISPEQRLELVEAAGEESVAFIEKILKAVASNKEKKNG